MRMIFSTVLGPHEPALTVGSLAITETGRPPIVPLPVTTPSAPRPSPSQLASSASSTKEPSSSSRATRWRTGSLPCSAAFARWRSGPPASARSTALSRCLVSVMRAPPDAARRPARRRPRGRGAGTRAASDPRVRHRLLAGVVVEPLAALAPQHPGADELAHRRRRREALLAELLEERLGGRAEDVEPDEVGELERAHRVVGAGLHRAVDLLDRADALLVAADAVEDVGDQQAVDDEAGRVARRYGQLALRLGERATGLEGLVGGRHRADDLDELHDLRRAEVVQAQEALGAVGHDGLVDDGERRGVRREERLGLDDRRDLLPHRPLELERLGDRLDDEVAPGKVAVVQRPAEAPADRVGVLLRRAALLDRARELRLDPSQPLVQPLLLDLAHDHVVARGGRHLCDPVSHQPGAQDADRLDLSHVAADPSY